MATVETFANQPQTTVSSGGTTAPAGGTTETWTVASSSSFPAASTGVTQFHVADTATGKTSEIILVTNVSGTTWSVTRGAEGTTPVAHSAGFSIVQVLTAGFLTSPVFSGAVSTGGLTGATAASRYAGATTSGAPVSGTFATGDFVTAQDGHQWICTAAGSPGTWALSGATLDPTASDIQPAGVQAAGSKGQGADARHVHPYQPWQFYADSSGAKGDGKAVTDGAMSSSSNPTRLACATSTPFAAGDVGKAILVSGAGAAGADLITTISSFTDSGHVVLAASASTTVSGKGVVWGTNDTSAINTAVSAAVTYAQANDNYAEVIFRPVIYVLASAASGMNSTYQTNAIIPLPVISTTAAKVTLVLKGLTAAPYALPHWQQDIVQTAGTCLAVLNSGGTNDATYGPAFVIAGPWNGYGETGGLFSNMMAVVDGITVSPPWNGTYGGFGFWGLAEMRVLSASYMPMALIAAAGPFPQFNANNITNQWTIGLLTPSGLNNAISDVSDFSAFGATYALMPSEHCFYDRCRLDFSVVGVSPVIGGNQIQGHPSRGGNLSVESCTYAIGAYTSGINSNLTGFPNFQIDCVSVENLGSNLLHDPTSIMTGIVGFQGVGYVNGYLTTHMISGGNFVRAIALGQTSGPQASPQAPPATTVAWQNSYYRDAWITLSSAGGTITALSITAPDGSTDSVAQKIATAATQQFLLPAGMCYVPTYTGVLSHTVTLL